MALVSTTGAHMATYAYDPYGEVTISNHTNNVATNLNPYRFAGGLNDRTTGFVKYGQRFYDPATGRFTQQDSLEVLADPSRGNRYQYSGSNPVNYIDSAGTDYEPTACSTTGLVVGLALGIAFPAFIAAGSVATGALAVFETATAAVSGGLIGEATNAICSTF